MKAAKDRQPAPDVVARLRELEGRLNSLSGKAAQDTKAFREAILAHEETRGGQLARAVEEASTFVLEITRSVDAKLEPRMSGVADRAIREFQSSSAHDMSADSGRMERRLEDRLGDMEEQLASMIERFGSVLQSGQRLEERLGTAGERLDEIWRQQDTTEIGGWRQVMRAVAAKVELETGARHRGSVHHAPVHRGAPQRGALPASSGGLRCSRCQTATVRRIKRATILEELLRLCFVAPYRCSACSLRSYHFR